MPNKPRGPPQRRLKLPREGSRPLTPDPRSPELPVIHSPLVVIQNPSVPRINQAAPQEPHFAGIYPETSRTQTQTSHNPGYNVPNTNLLTSQPRLPEYTYISDTLITRTHGELRAFLEHCWTIFSKQPLPTLFVTHPLHEIRTYTNDPLTFQDKYWRYRIILTKEDVSEVYHRITRNIRQNQPDRAILTSAFVVKYPWTGGLWTTYEYPGEEIE